MAQDRRSSARITDRQDIGAGPYLAKIISHLDPSFMGSLEVTLLRDQGNTIGEDTQTYVVSCAQPFFGYTGFEFMGSNDASKSSLDGFNDTQKSYGMWFVPPDVGVTVLVVFVDGDPSQGYWIGCIPSRFANHMVPAIGGSTEVDLDTADKEKYGLTPSGEFAVKALPVAEVNRRLNQKDQEIDVEKIKKPVHPIADRFLEQGLLLDDVRGVTTTTSRREAPSMVFGISTPGPLDRRTNAKKGTIGTKDAETIEPIPVSRLGGTQFVMDDGDDRYQRATPASEGPVKYADVLAGEKGDPTIPYNEYFRVRTRTGHQILMHNSEDLIYIANSKGTTWIELTANGKIDIYAKDSISIHTENDLNIKADRDINMEAGRNINMKSVSGRLRQEVAADWEVLVGANGSITVGGNYDHAIDGNTAITSGGNFDLNSGGNNKYTAGGNTDLKSGGNNKFTAGGNTDIRTGGNHTETAARIDMNGPVAAPADAAAKASIISPLSTHVNPVTSVEAGWKVRYTSSNIESIMKRIPMHEPWLLHENQAPDQLSPKDTDRDL